jgi:hypothetical protein
MSIASTKQYSIDGAAQIVTWQLGQGDDGEPVSLTNSADRTVQVLGTFGGASVVLEGSLEPTPVNYATLTDPQGNNLSIAAAKIESVTELVNFIRPRVVGGDGTTAITVHLLLRRTNK